MHEDYYGFSEKPFNLTPDPKYLFRSRAHAKALELLQFAIARREGFAVVTGDIGTGKTTLCRALLQQVDRKTFTALILNPFLSEEDLLRLILLDFGVVSREEIRRGRLAGVTKLELLDTLNEFLLSLLPLGAVAVLIIDEAQNLPLPVLEQIRVLSNLETDKEKLLQIVLVGQPNLKDLLDSPELRQLAQRVSIRCELEPLNRDETSAYVEHRLSVAGGGAAVTFEPQALDRVQRYTGGVPRLINLLCDRALLGGYSARTARITPGIVTSAATTLEMHRARHVLWGWAERQAAGFAAGAAIMALLAGGIYAAVQLQNGRASAEPLGSPAAVQRPIEQAPVQEDAAPRGERESRTAPGDAAHVPPAAPAASGPAATAPPPSRQHFVLVGSFRQTSEAERLATELEAQGYRVSSNRVDSGARGVWHQVFAGPYSEIDQARADEARIRRIPAYADARLVTR